MKPVPPGLRLFALPQSPYCAKVRAVLRYKDIPFEECEPAGGSYQTTEYQNLVPAGSIPAIQTGDFLLHDSQAIIELLEDLRPSPSVWSNDPYTRARQRALVQYHDTRFEPVTRELVAHARQPREQRDQHQLDLVRDRLFDRVYRLEKMVDPAPWLGGDKPSLADWVYPVTIAIAEKLLGALDADLDLPSNLQGWYDLSRDREPARTEVARAEAAIQLWLNLGDPRSQIH